MSYLIDGNNLMPVAHARTRKELLELAAGFASQKKVKVSVVFDGAEEEFFRDGASYKGVKIFYAKRNSNADERIKKLVEAERQRRTLFVVTSDTALANYCRSCGAQIIRSPDFCRRIEEAKLQNAEKKRLDGVKPGELDAWMRYFGVDETDD